MGLAQARQPLSTRRHYYELEIVDAGEKGYIALGLARRVSVLTGTGSGTVRGGRGGGAVSPARCSL